MLIESHVPHKYNEDKMSAWYEQLLHDYDISTWYFSSYTWHVSVFSATQLWQSYALPDNFTTVDREVYNGPLCNILLLISSTLNLIQTIHPPKQIPAMSLDINVLDSVVASMDMNQNQKWNYRWRQGIRCLWRCASSLEMKHHFIGIESSAQCFVASDHEGCTKDFRWSKTFMVVEAWTA